MNLKKVINSAMKKDQWAIFAGGMNAPSNKYGYSYLTNFGEYVIQPISKRYNVNIFGGYILTFVNHHNLLEGGLHQNLQKYHTLSQAMKMAKNHALYVMSRLISNGVFKTDKEIRFAMRCF